jgi:four helix bundle protein
MAIKSYQDLLAWQKAMDYVVVCYGLSQNFPREEIYGLRLQLRRSAVSIPSNIAEGYGRETRGEYIHFLGIARGSLKESETQIILAFRLKYVTSDQMNHALSLAQEVGKLLRNLIISLKPKTTP